MITSVVRNLNTLHSIDLSEESRAFDNLFCRGKSILIVKFLNIQFTYYGVNH